MSRQRIRTSVLESSTEKCPYCGGTGHTRSVSSVTLQLLRTLEDMLIKGATHNLLVRTRSEVALYVLNHKRAHLRELEQRFRVTITINADPSIGGQTPFVIERGEQVQSLEAARALVAQPVAMPAEDDEEEDEVETETEGAADAARLNGQPAEPGEGAGRRRRRRRRRPRGERPDQPQGAPATELVAAEDQLEPVDDGEGETEGEGVEDAAPQASSADGAEESERRRRRRGRRGGRRRRGREGDVEPAMTPGEFRADDEPLSPPGGHLEDLEPAAPPEAVPYEPELHSAVADFDRPPAAVEAPHGETSELQFTPASAENGPAEQPRRRSTIREPAPAYGSEAVAAPPPPAAEHADVVTQPSLAEPVPSTPPAEKESERADQPRRTGWWARRFAGDKT
jgi:ribonuclease E